MNYLKINLFKEKKKKEQKLIKHKFFMPVAKHMVRYSLCHVCDIDNPPENSFSLKVSCKVLTFIF